MYVQPRSVGTPLPRNRAVARAGLGFAPLALVTSLNTVSSILGLNSSDPVKDQQRIARIDEAEQAAMAGDTSAHPNLAGQTGLAYLTRIAGSSLDAGSAIAYRYAQTKLAEYKARVLAGTIGTGLIAQSNIPTQITGTIGRALSNPVVLGGLMLGAYLLISKKRGR